MVDKILGDFRPIPNSISLPGIGPGEVPDIVPIPPKWVDNPPKFLFRGGAIWWYTPGAIAARALRENTRPQPIPGETNDVEFRDRLEEPHSLKGEGRQQFLENRIQIYLYDEDDAKQFEGGPYIALDYVPEEIEINPSSLLKSLNIVGLNYPKYHYGGGEDIITFSIKWYGHGEEYDSVISKCRRIEALTKADGWIKGPPPIVIKWDNSNILFEEHVFIVEKAGYKISSFQLNKNVNTKKGYESFGLLPIVAIQKVVLKRIANQLTWDDIVYPRRLPNLTSMTSLPFTGFQL